MAILPILKYPDPILKQVAAPVASFDLNLQKLADDMVETMFAAPGAGLAAPQVGQSLRMVVVDDSPGDEYGLKALVLVNPHIVEREGELVYEEGCLSVVDYSAQVRRSARVVVRARDLRGRECEYVGEGRRAVVFQHELDHLDGTLFIDHLGPVQRDLYKRRLKKMARQAQEG